MRRMLWIALIAAALASSGCVVPSLYPLFTARDLVFDAALVGPWIDEDGDLWAFEPTGDAGYLLTLADADGVSQFDAHLVELGAHRFLDLYPRVGEPEDSFLRLHLLPVHAFYRVRLETDSLQLVPLNPDWLEKMIDTGGLEIAHARPDGNLLLTAPTEEIQDFVVRFADDPEAFPEDGDHSMVIDLERTAL